MGRMQPLGLKSLLPSGILCFVLLLFLLLPAQGLKCYECTNNDDGCFSATKVKIQGSQSIPSKYIKDCAAGAVSCIHIEIYYDFVFGHFFQRSCLYEPDKTCFDVSNAPWYPGNGSWVGSSGRWPWHYPETINCMKRNRFNASLPPPVLDERKNVLKMKAIGRSFRHFALDLGNDLYPMFDLHGEKRVNEPNTIDVKCNYCENERSTYDFQYWRHEHNYGLLKITPLPLCAERAQLKSIHCKGAYGCASFWEVRKEADREVSRVWRDCWYPGEMKCLRNLGGVGGARSLKKGRDAESCKKKFERANYNEYEGSVVWQGLEEVSTVEDYRAYLECVRNIREQKGAEFNWEVKQVEDFKSLPGENVTGPLAKIRYYYCSPKEACAGGKEVQPPTPPPTTTTTEPPTTTTTTVKPSTTQSTAGTRVTSKTTTKKPVVTGESGEEEIWDDCEDEGEENGGWMLQSSSYLVLVLIFILRK